MNDLDKFSNEIEIEDVSVGGFGGKQKKSFSSICLEHYRSCVIEGAKEMTTGGVRKRYIDGDLIEDIAPNQIQIFCNSVQMLQILLSPHIIKHDKLMKSKISNFESKVKRIMSIRKKTKNNTRKRYMQLSAVRNPTNPDTPSARESAKGNYNSAISSEDIKYENRKIVLYKELLTHLSFLLNKMGYFGESGETI